MIGLIFGPPGSGKGTQAARVEREFEDMRKNLPVFPHRRAGFAVAAALFPAEGIIGEFRLATPGVELTEPSRSRGEPGRPGHAGSVR